MTIGGDTYISSMLEMCGMKNIFKNKERYPEVDKQELSLLAPELILLSSEPFPFKEKHIGELKVLCPSSNILLVDGTFYSWYGNRMLAAAKYFAKMASHIN